LGAFVCLVALATPGAVRGQDGAGLCPLDREGRPVRLEPPAPAPWTAAGGVDSDGCRYGLSPDGGLFVAGLAALVDCPRCGLSYLPQHLDQAPSAEQAGRLAKLAQSPAATAWERAAQVSEVLLVDGDEHLDLHLADLYLQGAWAARGRAALSGTDVGYRPHGVVAARAQLDALERRVRADPRQAPEVKRLDALLADLEDTRAGVAPLPRDLPPLARRTILRSHAHLAELERQLLARKRDLLAQARDRGQGVSLAEGRELLARAWIRYGEPERHRALLARVEADRPERVAEIRAAVEEEARLLGLAAEAMDRAMGRASEEVRVRLRFLRADCARRLGDPQATALLREALAGAPEGHPARKAASALLEGR
jgi:hypothetical protein